MAKFTPGELEVMRILWRHGELKPAEIQEKFPRPIKNPALRSYLSILVAKGDVVRRRRGKAFYYKTKTKRQSALRSMFRELAHVFYDGSMKAVLFHLVQSEKLSPDEVAELKRLADGETTSKKSN
ncbi:MAG TPA: BlaI/MecI/CopY family transcriptional regulator [Pirellulales bacterium]|nr:BlaI/MecI/CopY family transcriptional regulator [Pirellulales bacterium]